MTSRRSFLKYAAAAAGAAGAGQLASTIQRALAIAPAPGSSYLDAEHVVILMQENRSFDHLYGRLRGVRGFDDPRAIRLPDGNPVWVQTNDVGQSFVPFRLNLLDTKATWMGCLPHSWTDQVDARNHGRYDRWLQAKQSGEPAYGHMPLTLGYYDRQDVPFYYELADAFTICDQHFCSALSSTTPNRSYLWTGTIRAKQHEQSPPHLFNADMDYGAEVSWTAFPERLEYWGVLWKVYQNELYLDVGFTDEEGSWLSNYGDNPLEYFTQYRARFSAGHRRFLEAQVQSLKREIAALVASQAENRGSDPAIAMEMAGRQRELAQAQQQRERWSAENFARLSPRDRALHERAFCTNRDDPAYRELAEVAYRDAGQQRRIQVPKGDVLHQFRKDVEDGALPTVSWLVAPERFSDHPSSAWYGAWYIAEALNILTQNPDVWRKTIFILTYDENDGYFDHAPPFVPPHPRRPETGRASASIDAALDYVDAGLDSNRRPDSELRDSPIGLGYRVPMIIASPWSRGGWVCSQVFDHTSPLQFLEQLLTHKLSRKVTEPNISSWRRAVCGDLTAAFQANPATAPPEPTGLERDAYVELIHRARFKELPKPGEPLTAGELDRLKGNPSTVPNLARQEPGRRPSCPLPYQLAADGVLSKNRRAFSIRLEAGKDLFGARSAGAPFTVYASPGASRMHVRNYAVAAGESLEDSWLLSDFDHGRYHLAVYGPNGFFREFRGDATAPAVEIRIAATLARAASDVRFSPARFHITNPDPQQTLKVYIEDPSYGGESTLRTMAPGQAADCIVDTTPGQGWYDVRIRLADADVFEARYAGRIETGRPGVSDPLIGRGG